MPTNTKPVTVSIPNPLLDRLDDARDGRPRSRVIVRAVEEFLDAHEEGGTDAKTK